MKKLLKSDIYESVNNIFTYCSWLKSQPLELKKKNNNNNNEMRIFHKQGATNADPNRSYISAILDAKAADSHTFFFCLQM